jgi:hypothetical protein
MKRAGIVATALLIGINVFSQKLDVDTILYNGNLDKHINLVILSDGYTDSELSKFVVDATSFTTAFFSEIPFSNYNNYFNVFIIKVPSNQSGASHPGTAPDEPATAQPVIYVDNYFGSTFDSYGIHRLLVATKTLAVSNVLAANFPNYDQALILVNSPYYGGSGGHIPVASTHTLSVQIALHELGHSFAGLNDEYWAGDNYASESINMTKQTDPSLVRWKNWIGFNLIGIYQHCCGGNSSLWYKPHQHCKMQFLGIPYCSVCFQGIVERIHSLVPPLEFYSPLNNRISPTFYPLKFNLALIDPIPNTLKISWLLAGASLEENIDSVSINESDLLPGINLLRVTIEDTTQFLRVDNHATIHMSSVSWYINNAITGVTEITSSSSEINIDLYPNPTSDYLNVKSGETKAVISFEIYDMQGQKLLSQKNVSSINLQNLSQGIYIIKIYFDNELVTTRKIIKE